MLFARLALVVVVVAACAGPIIAPSRSPDPAPPAPEKVAIGRFPGTRIVVETTDAVDTSPPVFHPVIGLTPGDVSIATARRLDLNLLDVDGGVLAIMVGGSIAEWDHATEIATPVLESVQIGD